MTMAVMIMIIIKESQWYPGESEAANSISQHVSEQRRKRVECWEVGVHVWTLPVCHLRRSDTAKPHIKQ